MLTPTHPSPWLPDATLSCATSMSPSVVTPTVTVLVSISTTVRWTKSRSWPETS
ncbi:hypothetical protein BJY00DRAFT_246029 [Aspergillus carlsbadensis]|nr:hypothetical protein BJY00DRAFT_246029 [Aspergillus carlsbadensis]